MALMTCVDCKGVVSGEALSCIHCGKPYTQRGPGFFGAICGLLFLAYLVITGLIIGSLALRALITWQGIRELPTSTELLVFLSWILTVFTGGLLISFFGLKPQKDRRARTALSEDGLKQFMAGLKN
jgi:hypothetical protein